MMMVKRIELLWRNELTQEEKKAHISFDVVHVIYCIINTARRTNGKNDFASTLLPGMCVCVFVCERVNVATDFSIAFY